MIGERVCRFGPNAFSERMSYRYDRSCASRKGIRRRDRWIDLIEYTASISGLDARSNKGWLHSSDFSGGDIRISSTARATRFHPRRDSSRDLEERIYAYTLSARISTMKRVRE